MSAKHLEFLVEELSCEAFLRSLLPRFLPEDRTYHVHSFQGKGDLLDKLRQRLYGYAKWLPEDWRIIVLVDRDDDDCLNLKAQLEQLASEAGLATRSNSDSGNWKVANRIAVEELEAWYFGDWQAVCDAYPRTSSNVPREAAYRDPDAIRGGTWEAFERVLQRHGYFAGGLRKLEAARAIAAVCEPERSTSRSFSIFWSAIIESTSGTPAQEEAS